MTSAPPPADETAVQDWALSLNRADQSVETIELRRGLSLILSRFDPGEARVFSFAEPEDMFGFGFHLKDGAQFSVETMPFETRALDVWACAMPRGSVSRFVLPKDGFRTVSMRFDPAIAEDYFDGGTALPRRAGDILKTGREDAGIAQLSSMGPAAAARLKSMFTTGYGGAARRLYLESCALELIAGQIGGFGPHGEDAFYGGSRHHERAMAARDYLDRHYRNPPTIAELSRLVGTNEFTLKRVFKEMFGTTIFAHVSQRRMEHAELLLRQGMTVSTTAQEVGYECVRSFSAAFRRRVGRPPSTVRRAGR